tara:strand:+ start:372 stop:734 length:363 start_codon:yes stop_codon:yes gene_type:complete
MKEQILKLQEVFTKAKGERIELGLVDDIEKIYGEVFNRATKLDKYKNNVISGIKEFKLQVVKAKNDSALGLKKVDEFKKAAKELGIDMPSKMKSLEKEFETMLKALKDWQSAAEQAMKLF